MKFEYLKNLGAIALCFGLASVCAAQDTPAAPTEVAQATPPAGQAPAAPAAPAQRQPPPRHFPRPRSQARCPTFRPPSSMLDLSASFR